MVADKLIHRCTYQYGILLILKDLQVTFGREDRKDARNDAWPTVKLILSRLVETECTDRIWDGLNDL
jgi:hypothetical protein